MFVALYILFEGSEPTVITVHGRPSVKYSKLSMSLLITKAPSAGTNSAYFLKLCLISSKSLKKSRWSAATFKIMARLGLNDRKLFVYSQASVINLSECPTRVFPLIAGIIPPTKIVGSVFA